MPPHHVTWERIVVRSCSTCSFLSELFPFRTLQVAGDELRLKLGPLGARQYGKGWEGSGHVLRITDGEVVLEMRNNVVPLEITEASGWCPC